MTQEIQKSNSLFAQLAKKYNITEKDLLNTLKNTIMKPDKTGREATEAEIISFLLVASKYDLNPFTKEIYAFPDKRAGIVPIVSIDGFVTLSNRQESFDGYEMTWSDTIVTNDGAKSCPEWCEIKVHRKDRAFPTIVREYLDEVYRPAFKSKEGYVSLGPWQTHTKRMLRHKTLIQGWRVAFGLSGIYDEDEAQRIIEAVGDAPQISMKPEVRIPQAIEVKAESPVPEQQSEIPIVETPNKGISEASAKHEAVTALAKFAFFKDKKKWLDFLGAEFGCENVGELTEAQIPQITAKLNEIIKDAKT